MSSLNLEPFIKMEKREITIQIEKSLKPSIEIQECEEKIAMANFPQCQPRKKRTVTPSDRVTRHQGRVTPFRGEIIEDGPAMTSRLRQKARKPRRLRLTGPKHPWAGIKRINCRYKHPTTGNTRWHRGPGVVSIVTPVAAARNPWDHKR
ncbi:MAG: hypothetical protein Q9212_007455 [Teloschistes hypoglaucus]